VPIYLFRDENCRDTFAYSTDVTGRSIPRATARTRWSFVGARKIQEIHDREEVSHHIDEHGFYVFRKPNAP
jgi:hypothetical protein